MAINAYGVVGSIDDSHWAKLFYQFGVGGAEQAAVGLAVTVATGTRLVNVQQGSGYAAGVLVIAASGTTYTATVAANNATQSRIDVVCMTVDWAAATAAYNANTGSEASKANSAASAGAYLQTVAGTAAATPSVPTLTQTPGVLWQIPLARVLVRPGVGQLLASDITDARPYAPERVCSGTVTVSDGGSDPKTVDVTFPLGFFTGVPRVQVSPQTGAAAGTTSNLYAGNTTKTGFTAGINRSTTTSVVVNWTASGY